MPPSLQNLAARRKGTIGAITLLAVWLPAFVIGRSAVIDGQRYWFLADEAMISMRYARNLASGLGLA